MTVKSNDKVVLPFVQTILHTMYLTFIGSTNTHIVIFEAEACVSFLSPSHWETAQNRASQKY